MGYPSAALTSRSAPALYPQQGSCPSYTSGCGSLNLNNVSFGDKTSSVRFLYLGY